MSMQELKILELVASSGSMSDAGRALGISSAVVSKLAVKPGCLQSPAPMRLPAQTGNGEVFRRMQMSPACNDFALALAVANGDIEFCALQCDVSDALCAPARIAALLGRFLPRLGAVQSF